MKTKALSLAFLLMLLVTGCQKATNAADSSTSLPSQVSTNAQ